MLETENAQTVEIEKSKNKGLKCVDILMVNISKEVS